MEKNVIEKNVAMEKEMKDFVNMQSFLDKTVFSVNGHIVNHGLEVKNYGCCAFGLLEPDTLYGDEHYDEWTYGVEIGGDVVNGKTRVYRLEVVSDVIVDVKPTEHCIPVRPLLVRDVLKRKKKAGLVWLDKITYEKGKWFNCAIKLEDAIINEEKVLDKVLWVCPLYQSYWNFNDAIGDPSKIVRFGQTCFLKR